MGRRHRTSSGERRGRVLARSEASSTPLDVGEAVPSCVEVLGGLEVVVSAWEGAGTGTGVDAQSLPSVGKGRTVRRCG